jgi:hypothetical protein
MPFGREPGAGKGRPLGRVGIWGTEPGRPVGAVKGGGVSSCMRGGGGECGRMATGCGRRRTYVGSFLLAFRLSCQMVGVVRRL